MSLVGTESGECHWLARSLENVTGWHEVRRISLVGTESGECV
jgi:hypothetical protein